MQNLCPAIVDLGTFACHLDYWAARYQSGFFALLALTVAITQMRVARQLASLSKEQFRMAQTQREIEKAVATITVDQFLVPTHFSLGEIIARVLHTDTGRTAEAGWAVWHWNPKALAIVAMPIPSGFEAAAMKAFPDQSPFLVQLSKAVDDINALAAEYALNPWQDTGDEQAVSPTQRDVQKSHATDNALNRFFVAANQCGRLQPGNRVPT